jgi:hypothetical protein
MAEATTTDAEARRVDWRKRFYSQELDLSQSTRDVLVNYSKIDPEQVEAHVKNIVLPPRHNFLSQC